MLTSTGEPTEIVLRAGGIFRADVYSQNEVEDIADRALSQLVLLDNFESERIAAIEGKIRSVETSLAANASRIGPLQREIIALAEEIGTLPGVEEKLKAFASVGGDDAKAINLAHQHKALRDRERRAVEGIWQYLGEYQQQLDATAGQIAGRVGALFARDILGGPNGATLGQIRVALLECGSEVDDLLRSAQSAVERLVSNLGESGQALAGIHTQQEIQFRTLIEKHQEAQEQTLERSRLEKLRNDLLAKRRLKEELEVKLTKALREREMLLITLSEHRNHRFAIRKEVADRINVALTPTSSITSHWFFSSHTVTRRSGQSGGLSVQARASALPWLCGPGKTPASSRSTLCVRSFSVSSAVCCTSKFTPFFSRNTTLESFSKMALRKAKLTKLRSTR